MRKKYVLENEGLLVQLHDPYTWALGQIFAKSELTNNDGCTYICTVAHTANAAYEPGTGADWEDVFILLAEGSPGETGAQGIPGGTLAWKGAYNASTQYAANDGVLSAEGRGCYAVQSTKGNAPPSYPTTSNAYWSVFAEAGLSGIQADGSVAMTGALTMTQIATPSEPASSKTAIYAKSDGKIYKYANGGAETEIGSGAGFWSDVPGTPTRVSNSQFTITDTSNANKYDKVFARGTILKWLESGNFKTAIITASSYGTNAVTITMIGSALAAGFTAMKYCIHKAQRLEFIVPGTLAAVNDVGRTHWTPCAMLPIFAEIWLKTAGATGNTVVDINANNTSLFTSKPTAAGTATSGWAAADDPLTPIAESTPITIDIDSVTTTPPVDLYVILHVYPEAWRYIA